MATKIAINGFGRIGRLSFRKMFEDEMCIRDSFCSSSAFGEVTSADAVAIAAVEISFLLSCELLSGSVWRSAISVVSAAVSSGESDDSSVDSKFAFPGSYNLTVIGETSCSTVAAGSSSIRCV